MTRCKVGDLAVVIRSTAGNEGKIVRVLRLIGRAEFSTGAMHDDCWLVEGNVNIVGGGRCAAAKQEGGDGVIPDANLRPIRDPGDDARDETLDWLPSPVETA